MVKNLHPKPKFFLDPKYILISGLILILGLIFILFKTQKVGKLELNNPQALCFQASNLRSLVDTSFRFWWQVDQAKLTTDIKAKYPCVKVVQIGWKFPNSLVVTVEARVALVQVANFKYSPKLDLTQTEATPASQSETIDFSRLGLPTKPTYIADQEGVVFDATYEDNLPVVYLANQQLNLGTKLETDLLVKIGLIVGYLNNITPGRLTVSNPTIVEIKVIKDDIIVPSMPAVILSSSKDISRQLASLQLILDTATINQRPIKYVDLRFGKPIIVYESPTKT